LCEQLKEEARLISGLKAYQDNVFESVTAAIVGLDLRGSVLSANGAARAIFGIGEQAVEGVPSSKLFGPALTAQLSRGFAMALAGTPAPPFIAAGEVGGSDRYLRCILTPLSEEGKTTGLVFLAEDETARVRAERAKEREEAERRKIRELFGHFVAEPVVERLVANPEYAQLGGSRREVTVLFADIRGYTTLAEGRTPEELMSLLGRYLALAADTIIDHGGTLDKFMGDGVMAVFNAPLDQPDHALAAVRAGFEMQRKAVGQVEGLTFGVGINSGPVLAGNLGSDRYRNYCCVGDATNVASRIQGHAEGGQVLITEATLEFVRDHVIVEPVGPLQVKGRSAPVVTYRLLDLTAQAR
jgi:PAS domain S-box-containing protein